MHKKTFHIIHYFSGCLKVTCPKDPIPVLCKGQRQALSQGSSCAKRKLDYDSSKLGKEVKNQAKKEFCQTQSTHPA